MADDAATRRRGAPAAPLATPGAPPPRGRTARRPGRPRDHDSDDTRRMLLEAALDAFAEHGFDGVSTRDLAQRAEVSATTLFHHFATKDDLYAAAYEHAVGMAYEHYHAAVEGGTSLADEMHRMLAAAEVLLTERPAIALLSVRVQIDAEHRSMHVANRPAAVGQFRADMVARAMARGELAATDGLHVHRLLDVFLWGVSVLGYEDPTMRRESIAALHHFIDAALP